MSSGFLKDVIHFSVTSLRSALMSSIMASSWETLLRWARERVVMVWTGMVGCCCKLCQRVLEV